MTRRVVTGLKPAGRPGVISDGPPPRSARQTATPGMVNTLVWSTSALPTTDAADPTPHVTTFVPGTGETRVLMVTFPPDVVFTDPAFDGAAAAAEQRVATPGLAELFEPDAPGMHSTPSVDYAVLLTGKLVLDLDGEAVELEPGDVVVQNGVRHAWRNPSEQPATLFVVLVGAVSAQDQIS